MSRRYNFRESQELLHVDPKTFGRWLEKANIDPEQQVNRADPRQKWLTEEQLVMLATEHDRELPPLDQDQDNEPQPAEAVILTTVDERLAALEQVIEQRFALVYERLELLRTELQHARISAPPQEQPPIPAPQDVIAAPASASASPPSPASTTTPPKPTAKQHPKRKTKAKRLPRTLIALRDFANQHNIVVERASAAGKSGKITIVSGKWLVNSRWAFEALSKQGQHDFYEIFHNRQGFTPCEHCPHSLSAAS